MKVGAPTLGWGALVGAALAASVAPLAVQLGFAVLAIGVIGMAHGASDLAIVEHRRRPSFLGLYALAAAACLFWWLSCPALALPLFLLASAVHFGREDAPADAPVERLARGVGLVAAPAVFHRAELRALLDLAGGNPVASAGLVHAMAAGGVVAAAALLVIAARRADLRLALGTASLSCLPPLVGFSIGFLILHAVPQTVERQAQMGCRGMADYLRQVAPLLAAAVVLVGVIGAVVLQQEATGVRSLFVAVAALAAPHLLVTPFFEAAPSEPRRARNGEFQDRLAYLVER